MSPGALAAQIHYRREAFDDRRTMAKSHTYRRFRGPRLALSAQERRAMGDRVMACRWAGGLTLAAVAGELGVCVNSIVQWEHGSIPRDDMRVRLAAFYRVEEAALFAEYEDALRAMSTGAPAQVESQPEEAAGRLSWWSDQVLPLRPSAHEYRAAAAMLREEARRLDEWAKRVQERPESSFTARREVRRAADVVA